MDISLGKGTVDELYKSLIKYKLFEDVTTAFTPESEKEKLEIENLKLETALKKQELGMNPHSEYDEGDSRIRKGIQGAAGERLSRFKDELGPLSKAMNEKTGKQLKTGVIF